MTTNWIEMDDRTNYKIERAGRVLVSSIDDVTPEDEALIAQSLGQRLGGTWRGVSEWQAAEGENETVRPFERLAYETSLSKAIAWARTATAGSYLVRYADTGMTDEEDPGSRCGYGDDELDEIKQMLARRNLRFTADDRGLLAEDAE